MTCTDRPRKLSRPDRVSVTAVEREREGREEHRDTAWVVEYGTVKFTVCRTRSAWGSGSRASIGGALSVLGFEDRAFSIVISSSAGIALGHEYYYHKYARDEQHESHMSRAAAGRPAAAGYGRLRGGLGWFRGRKAKACITLGRGLRARQKERAGWPSHCMAWESLVRALRDASKPCRSLPRSRGPLMVSTNLVMSHSPVCAPFSAMASARLSAPWPPRACLHHGLCASLYRAATTPTCPPAPISPAYVHIHQSEPTGRTGGSERAYAGGMRGTTAIRMPS
ncbi:hypothetical protein C8R44DRAFT_929441 [Mycena epipterygia]|nr:hypothetical protein C8R44DRAFT_929441 [Mycena epipterygia]